MYLKFHFCPLTATAARYFNKDNPEVDFKKSEIDQSKTDTTVEKNKDDNNKEKLEQQKMEEEEAKKRDATWKTMKYSFIAFGASFGLLGSYMIYQLGIITFKMFFFAQISLEK